MRRNVRVGDEVIPEAGCDDRGCKVNFEKNFPLRIKTGSSAGFSIGTGAGLSNVSVQIEVGIITCDVEMQYMYIHPEVYSLAGFAIHNVDESGYSDCMNMEGHWSNAVTATGVELEPGSTVAWTAHWYKRTAWDAPPSEKACTWNTYFDDISFCIRRELATTPRHFTAFQLSERMMCSGDIKLGIGKEQNVIKFDTRETDYVEWSNSAGTIKLQLQLTHSDVNPLTGRYVVYDGKYDTANSKVTIDKWLAPVSLPSQGSLPGTGIGSVQSSRYSDTGTYTDLNCDKFKEQPTITAGGMDIIAHDMKLKAYVKDIFLGRTEYITGSRVIMNMHPNGTRILVSMPQDKGVKASYSGWCKVNWESPSRTQMDIMASNSRKMNDGLGVYKPILPKEATTQNGLPQLQTMRFNDILDITTNVLLSSNEYDVVFQTDGAINYWNYSLAHNVVNAAGSFVTLYIDYRGSAAELAVTGREIVLYDTSIQVVAGINKKNIAYKNTASYTTDFTICILNDCKSPDKVENSLPPNSTIDDPDQGGATADTTFSDLFKLLLDNGWLFASCVIMWILDALAIALLIWVSAKLIKKFWFLLMGLCMRADGQLLKNIIKEAVPCPEFTILGIDSVNGDTICNDAVILEKYDGMYFDTDDGTSLELHKTYPEGTPLCKVINPDAPTVLDPFILISYSNSHRIPITLDGWMNVAVPEINTGIDIAECKKRLSNSDYHVQCAVFTVGDNSPTICTAITWGKTTTMIAALSFAPIIIMTRVIALEENMGIGGIITCDPDVTDRAIEDYITTQLGAKGALTISLIRDKTEMKNGWNLAHAMFHIKCDSMCIVSHPNLETKHLRGVVMHNGKHHFKRGYRSTAIKDIQYDSYYISDKVYSAKIDDRTGFLHQPTVDCYGYDSTAYFCIGHDGIGLLKSSQALLQVSPVKFGLSSINAIVPAINIPYTMGDDCSGSLIMSRTSSRLDIQCTDSCCVVSSDGGVTQKLLDPTHLVNTSSGGLLHYTTETESHQIGSITGCITDGSFSGNAKCWKDDWPESYWSTVLIVPVAILLVIVIILIRKVSGVSLVPRTIRKGASWGYSKMNDFSDYVAHGTKKHAQKIKHKVVSAGRRQWYKNQYEKTGDSKYLQYLNGMERGKDD